MTTAMRIIACVLIFVAAASLILASSVNSQHMGNFIYAIGQIGGLAIGAVVVGLAVYGVIFACAKIAGKKGLFAAAKKGGKIVGGVVIIFAGMAASGPIFFEGALDTAYERGRITKAQADADYYDIMAVQLLDGWGKLPDDVFDDALENRNAGIWLGVGTR